MSRLVLLLAVSLAPASAGAQPKNSRVAPKALLGHWDMTETVHYSTCDGLSPGDARVVRWDVRIVGGKLEALVEDPDSKKTVTGKRRADLADPSVFVFLFSGEDIDVVDLRLESSGALVGRRTLTGKKHRPVVVLRPSGKGIRPSQQDQTFPCLTSYSVEGKRR